MRKQNRRRTKANVGGIGSKMAGGNPDPERGREAGDFYATPANVTRAFVNYYQDTLKDMVVWEPCAGDGAMAVELKPHVRNIVCTDIEARPLLQSAVDADIHLVPADVLKATRLPPVQAVITNPPFNIAAAIARHILTLPGGPPQLLALVLKSTFWHAQSRYLLFKDHPPTAIHPLVWRPDFKSLGAPTMEFMWCVWEQEYASDLTIYEPFEHPDVARYGKRSKNSDSK